MNAKILIVDDNETLLEIMCYILTNNGYQVTSLNSGRHVMEEVSHTRPDLVILDMELGDMDGRDICKILKGNKITRNMPVIICSANDEVDQVLTQQGPPDDILHKPFDLNEFIKKVEFQLAA